MPYQQRQKVEYTHLVGEFKIVNGKYIFRFNQRTFEVLKGNIKDKGKEVINTIKDFFKN